MRASRILALAFVVAVFGILAATPAHANCANSFGMYVYNTTFDACGDNPYIFYWGHRAAKQGTTGLNAQTAGVWGNDSGSRSTVADNMASAMGGGQYQLFDDVQGVNNDGCVYLATEGDAVCGTTTSSYPPIDYVISYSDPATLQAYAAVISTDYNEIFQYWQMDQAGAPSSGGSTCGDDAIANTIPYACGALPVPQVTSNAGCDATGCTLNVTIGSHGVPIVTDCNVAASRATDCTGPAGDPRNLYGGRELFVLRAPCDATSPANIGTFDARTFIMNNDANTATPHFVPYAPQDLNLNGVQDGGEVTHLPLVLTGNDAQTVPVKIPKIAGATDCAYLGVGLLLDNAPLASACGGACGKVVTPVVSVSQWPIGLDTATPAGDRVINLKASKASGKVGVSWTTTAELATAGFNLIGSKKGGAEVKINSALIPAQKGTTGESANYNQKLSPGDLKGSTAVYVELIKTNGAKERFGPASF